ncbi:class I SAM-dependent methyltransferase [uncultured Ilyobacter sp.]|uniref:class I SAM-dependent methyltransferase n=1 Tax=uncultured Ilyobacter sp. TaxID=544433 RepID=UPI0029F4DE9C|nr:class I SAM-dependent methyltransferase [uncultured Ilyobacter sp.]
MKAYMYDNLMNVLEKKKLRNERKILLENIRGKIIELGAGTGVNFEFYTDNEVIAVEPDEVLNAEAQKKIGSKNIKIISAFAEELPFEDNTFDTVLITLALCTIPNPEKALKEAERICKRGGQLLILEHIKNENRFLFSLQNILTPVWKKFAMGCHLNRDTLSFIKNNNFEQVSLKYFWGNNFVSGVFKNIK